MIVELLKKAGEDMTKNRNLEDSADILKKLKTEEKRIRKILIADADDFKELQSEWQERDSPAERNLREVEWDQYSSLKEELSEITDAKLRLAEGTYGVCEDCHKKISAKRIANVLTARKCISCQEQSEKDSGIFNQKVSL
jgi:RNA polymerase-binding transcription factor DksA